MSRQRRCAPSPLWERVGVRGSGLSIDRNPSPGSHLRCDIAEALLRRSFSKDGRRRRPMPLPQGERWHRACGTAVAQKNSRRSNLIQPLVPGLTDGEGRHQVEHRASIVPRPWQTQPAFLLPQWNHNIRLSFLHLPRCREFMTHRRVRVPCRNSILGSSLSFW
jgi:hypothetical protein